MPNKIYDNIRLTFTLVIISPLLAAAAIIIGIGYPLHVLKSRIIPKR